MCQDEESMEKIVDSWLGSSWKR